MLQSIRQMAHSWVVKGLMLFLIISFSIWGIGDMFRGKPLPQKTVATVGNTEIIVQQLTKSFDETLVYARKSLNPNLTAAQARQMGLLDKTLDNDINRNLIDLDVKRQGIETTPQSVLQMLADQPQFRTKEGTFNKQLFELLIKQQGLTESSFVARGQQEMARHILLDAIGGTNTVPQTEVDALYRARAQKRILDVVTVDSSKLGGIAAPDSKTLHDFYDKNAQLFTAPEYRGLTIATLSTEAIAKTIVISDDQLKKAYDAKADELTHPEQRDIVQVVSQTEDRAKQLSKQARAAGDLTEAAKGGKESAVPLDQMEEKNLMPELAKVVFALKEDEISAPVKTQLGWHVVQLKKITPSGKPDFDAVKRKLRDDLQRDQAIEAATHAVNQLDDQLAAGHSLDDIADELKLRVVKIASVDTTGSQPNGKEASELPNKETVLKDAFAQNAGDTSPVEDDKAGNYTVVRTDQVTLSGVKPFDSIKTDIIAAWKANEQMDKARAKADKIAQSLRKGATASSFANDESVSVRVSAPLSQMGDTDSSLPSDLLAQALKINKGETATGTIGSKQIVIRLANIIEADAASLQPDPRKNQILGEIRKSIAEDLLDQYVQHLYTVFPVKKDNALMDQLRQQGN